MSRKQPLVLNIRAHVILYQYRDIPDEWHAICLEFSSMGCGPTPEAAFDEMFLTLEGQFETALDEGHAAVFGPCPDPEWVQAYRDGKHPIDPDDIVLVFRGIAKMRATMSGKKPRITSSEPIEISPSISEGELQPA